MNFLFGWLLKPQYQLTMLDKIIGTVEMLGVLFIALIVCVLLFGDIK